MEKTKPYTKPAFLLFPSFLSSLLSLPSLLWVQYDQLPHVPASMMFFPDEEYPGTLGQHKNFPQVIYVRVFCHSNKTNN